jgi:phosphonate transport system permease protein
MTSPSEKAAGETGGAWRRPHFVENPYLRWGIIVAIAVYLVYASNAVELNPERFWRGIPRAGDFISRMFPPDYSRWKLLFDGVLESLQMAFFSTFLGTILSIPIAIGGAVNVAPRIVYLICRGYISISRTFPEVIIAILLVKALGFGPFAGMLTLVVASTGFVGKLLAEDIEDIDAGQVEAIEATGAGWGKMLLFGVFPQVMPRLIGLTIYRLDINLRESTIIGIVGAGGIGGALFNSFQRYEYDFSLAILIVIIGLVMIAEWGSGEFRKRVQ